MEKWRVINEFPKYAVSDRGRVRNVLTSNILSPWISNSGYYMVGLRDQYGKKYNRYIHRLVAEAFLYKISDDDEINHINGDKLDNDVNNLEWCIHSYNTRHAIETGLFTPYKLPPRYDTFKRVRILETGETFESISACARHLNRTVPTLHDHIKGNSKTCAGYHVILID